ncbi:MAG: hypothetical protein ACOX9C_01875 [Kiritimatiellia bacterium]|jgi:hypothetical protein
MKRLMPLADNTRLSLCLALILVAMPLYLLKVAMFPKVIGWAVAVVAVVMALTARVIFLARKRFANECYKVLYDPGKHVAYLCTLSGGVYARKFEHLKAMVDSVSFPSFMDACEYAKGKAAEFGAGQYFKNFFRRTEVHSIQIDFGGKSIFIGCLTFCGVRRTLRKFALVEEHSKDRRK